MKAAPIYAQFNAAREAVVLRYLRDAGWSVDRAAGEAGVDQSTFRRWMRELGIKNIRVHRTATT